MTNEDGGIEAEPTETIGHQHCWHRDNPLKAVVGGGDCRDVCCQCGALPALPSYTPDRIPPGHGAYFIGAFGDVDPKTVEFLRTVVGK